MAKPSKSLNFGGQIKMKKFYFRLDGDIITDAIDYPFTGYTEATLNENYLPAGINAGYYKWNGTAYERDDVLFNASVSEQVAKGKEEGREEIRDIVRGTAALSTFNQEAKTELINKGVLPANASLGVFSAVRKK